jgi:hypothetical protein
MSVSELAYVVPSGTIHSAVATGVMMNWVTTRLTTLMVRLGRHPALSSGAFGSSTPRLSFRGIGWLWLNSRTARSMMFIIVVLR